MLDNKYDPRLKKFEELEQTFACGETILEELAEGLKPGKKKELSRQSWVITGARGAGKSHLLALLYYRIKNDKKLSKYWLPLLFPEELFGVDSLYRMLLQVLEYIFKSDSASGLPAEFREEFLEIKKIKITGGPKQKRETRHHLAKQLFELLVKLRSALKKSFILMLENLQYLFREQLSTDDVKLLRSFMNEQPGVFVIIGTALTVFDEIADYGKPFYHFFRVRSMGNLDREEIIDFLLKLSAYRKDESIEERIETNRRYIYLYQLLTGGNPRLLLFLYELLLGNETLDTYMILGKIAELTPYFLDKTRDESGQRKLILDALAMEAPAQTAREIAEYVNEDYKSIGEQLKRLSAEGWIREISIDAEDVKKNEVFYTLRDYFYRLWYRTRTKSIEESDTLCMAELAVFLFDRQEIEDRLKKYTGSNEDIRLFYKKSLELSANEAFMRSINRLLEEAQKKETIEIANLLIKIAKCLNDTEWEKLIKYGEKILRYSEFKEYGYYQMGIGYSASEKYKKAIECYKKSIAIKPDSYDARFEIGFCHYSLGNYNAAYAIISEGINYRLLSQEKAYGPYLLALRINALRKIASEIFNSSVELQILLDKNSTPEIKLEALCRLLLLGKFSSVTDVTDELLKRNNLTLDETKKLELLIEATFLDEVKSQRQNQESKIYLKYWTKLLDKRYDRQTVRKRFMHLINTLIQTKDKKDIFQKTIESMGNQAYEGGTETLDILYKIKEAIENPRTREIQQWMVDPLFSEIVALLSENL